MWNRATTKWQLIITKENGEKYKHPVLLYGEKEKILKQLYTISFCEKLGIPDTFLMETFELEIII